MVGLLDTNNAPSLLALADAHSADELKEPCMKFIQSHLIDVMLTEDWPLIDTLFIEELNKRLTGKKTKADDDEEVQEEDENMYPNKKKKKADE